jgi:alpha-amylase
MIDHQQHERLRRRAAVGGVERPQSVPERAGEYVCRALSSGETRSTLCAPPSPERQTAMNALRRFLAHGGLRCRGIARTLALASLLAAALPTAARADAVLHAFNWRYADIEARASEIRELGYAAVLVSPPLKSEGPQWWARYQPQDYRVIDSPLGNTEDFVRMSAALELRGVKLYADLVLNHMANEADRRTDLNYPGARVRSTYAGDPPRWQAQRLFGDLSTDLFDAADFNPAFCITDYNNAAQVQSGRLCSGGGDPGLPDLQGSAKVIAAQRQYVSALIALGADGFRLDAAKHMTLAHVNAVFDPALLQGRPVYGEIITGGGRGNTEYAIFLKPWLDQTALSAYDFPLFHRLRQAFGFGGDLSTLLNARADEQSIDPRRAWTFAVNHDLPLNGIFRGLIMDATDETLAWAWLFANGQGTPLLYSDNNESGDNRWNGLYRRTDIAAMIGFHNALAGEPMAMVSSSNCHLLFRRGDRALVGINKCGEPRTFAVDADAHPLRAPSRFRDALSTHVLAVDGGPLRVELPPRSARLWRFDAEASGCGPRRLRDKTPQRCTQDDAVPAAREPRVPAARREARDRR